MSFRKSISIIKNVKSANLFLVLGICLIIIGFTSFFLRPSEALREGGSAPVITPAPISTSTYSKVIRVFDGDTIEIEGGAKVRYIGIDAAEVYPKRLCFSDEALARNRELVSGKVVRLEKDVSETDKYGRLLRYVYVDDIFVNNELTKEGFTKIMTVPPDVKYKDLFLESEKNARGNGLGLWGKCF